MDNNTLKKFKNFYTILQVSSTIISIGIVIANSFVVSKLAPVVEDIKDVSVRVKAIEDDRKAVPEFRQKVLILEERTKTDHETLNKIETNVNDIRNFLLNK